MQVNGENQNWRAKPPYSQFKFQPFEKFEQFKPPLWGIDKEKMKNNTWIGQKKWHRIFGWCEITHDTPNGKTVLCNSEHSHIEQYRAGIGITVYKGENGGKISSIHIDKDEFFDEPQKDKIQGAMSYLITIIS